MRSESDRFRPGESTDVVFEGDMRPAPADTSQAWHPDFLAAVWPKSNEPMSLRLSDGTLVWCQLDTEGRRCGAADVARAMTCMVDHVRHGGPHIGQTDESMRTIGPIVSAAISKLSARPKRGEQA